MLVKGISEGFHDASVALVDDEGVVWAKHAERTTITNTQQQTNERETTNKSRNKR